uniref:Uncharacterized protein n=1 Tax=Arundo donax TaxID=35708 RepID=A0A0A9AW02_ARUDO
MQLSTAERNLGRPTGRPTAERKSAQLNNREAYTTRSQCYLAHNTNYLAHHKFYKVHTF